MAYCRLSIVPSTLLTFDHLILIATAVKCCYLHLTDDETEAQGVSGTCQVSTANK